MRRALMTAIAALALTTAAPSLAAVTFSNPADAPTTINIVGNQPGTSGTLFLDLTGNSGGLFTFSYTVTNTSDLAINPFGVISSFGFNDIGLSTTTGSVTGAYTNIIFGGQGPGPFDGIQVCFNNSGGGGSGCSGGGGVAVGSPGSGTFTLQYDASVTSLTLGDFAFRFQSLGANGSGSGTGTETGVPEPATWGMMLLGFAGIGMALRRSRRRSDALLQVA